MYCLLTMRYEFQHVKYTDHEWYCAEEHIGAVRQSANESDVLEKKKAASVLKIFDDFLVHLSNDTKSVV